MNSLGLHGLTKRIGMMTSRAVSWHVVTTLETEKNGTYTGHVSDTYRTRIDDECLDEFESPRFVFGLEVLFAGERFSVKKSQQIATSSSCASRGLRRGGHPGHGRGRSSSFGAGLGNSAKKKVSKRDQHTSFQRGDLKSIGSFSFPGGTQRNMKRNETVKGSEYATLSSDSRTSCSS